MMPSRDDALRCAIRTVVRAHLRQPIDLHDDTPLVSTGLIDSMSLVDLVLDLEQSLGVSVPSASVRADDFDTVSLIARAITGHRHDP